MQLQFELRHLGQHSKLSAEQVYTFIFRSGQITNATYTLVLLMTLCDCRHGHTGQRLIQLCPAVSTCWVTDSGDLAYVFSKGCCIELGCSY